MTLGAWVGDRPVKIGLHFDKIVHQLSSDRSTRIGVVFPIRKCQLGLGMLWAKDDAMIGDIKRVVTREWPIDVASQTARE